MCVRDPGLGGIGEDGSSYQMLRNPLPAQNTSRYLPFEKGALLLDTPLKSLKKMFHSKYLSPLTSRGSLGPWK